MRKTATIFLAAISSFIVSAQDSFYDDYNNFLKEAREEYVSFRDQMNKEYADFLAAPWESIQLDIITKPEERTEPPRPIEEEDYGRKNQSINFDKVVQPTKPKPQPKPVEPVVIKQQPTDQWISFTYLGNTDKVRLPSGTKVNVNDISENGISNSWKGLSNGSYDALLSDCLSLRSKYNLPDWAYLNMLDIIAREIYPNNKNAATLLTAWLYSQSGYQMRLGRDSNNLVMMFATDHIIYGPYYRLDGTNYTPFKSRPSSLDLSRASFPNEKSMSLVLTSLPKTNSKMSSPRNRKSRLYPELNYDLSVDENLIEFFNTYPNSQLGNDKMTRWAIYANTPMSAEIKEQLYPRLRQDISALSDRDKVQHILNWVQTGFIYEYDDKVWGGDRAFFPDETIYYPYADCEDRAILFTRLVRDLVGLDAILVYYPGHLASAIGFNGTENGDYIMLNGRRFTVCDPTFVDGAPVGRTATGMNNSTATVILLNR